VSFQANDCTDSQIPRKQNTTYTLNTKEKQEKTALDNKTNCSLVWYAFYDFWTGNGVDGIRIAVKPTQEDNNSMSHCRLQSVKYTVERTF